MKHTVIIANILSSLFLLIISTALLSTLYFYTKGQIEANKAIAAVGESIVTKMSTTDSSDESDKTNSYYIDDIKYLENAQQIYSENSSMKITSLIYALSTTIILGYGAKMLRLGATDKKALCEELLEKSSQQFINTSDKILIQQHHIYSAISACETAATLSLMLLSANDLNKINPNSSTNNIDFISRLQIELTRALTFFSDLLKSSSKHNPSIILSDEQFKMLYNTWKRVESQIKEYGLPEKNSGEESSCAEKLFSEYDAYLIKILINEIDEFFLR